MKLRGNIIGLNTETGSSEYGIVCRSKDGIFGFLVEESYLRELIEKEGRIFDRKIEYDDKLKSMRFLD